MKSPLILILVAGFILAFKPADPALETKCRAYAEAKLGKLERFELIKADTLTDRLRLSLKQSRITDSLVILQPVLNAVQKLFNDAQAAARLYPKEASFKKSLVDATRQLAQLKDQLRGMIGRSDELDRQIAQADASAFRGYLAQAAMKRYEQGNRAVTIYDTATIALTPDLTIIDKSDW